MQKTTVASPCDLENYAPTENLCEEQKYHGRSDEQREGVFLKGRDCATEGSGLKSTRTSKPMPKLLNHLMPGMSAEDEDVVSRRSFRLMVHRHSGSVTIPPAGRFSQVSNIAVGALPRSRSENDFESQQKSFRSAHHRRMSDLADSSDENPGLTMNDFHARPASVFSVWESIMTHTNSDDIDEQLAC